MLYNVCVCVCTYACLHVYLCMFTCVPMHVYMCTYACLHVYLCMFTCVPMHVYMCTYACLHVYARSKSCITCYNELVFNLAVMTPSTAYPFTYPSQLQLPPDLRCSLPGCSKPKYFDAAIGIEHECCSKAHALEYQRSTLAIAGDCPNLIQRVH